MINILFLVSTIILFYYAVRLMMVGWRASDDKYLSKVLEEKTTQVTRPPHPELQDLKPGDELLVVNFHKEEPKDPLHQSLQRRVDELNDPWYDDDDDDDGDVPAVVRR